MKLLRTAGLSLRTFMIFLVVLYHAGVVYESSSLTASLWIVDDPSTSNLPGLLNVIMDIFIMPTFFFFSGFFTPLSLEKGVWRFLKGKLRRLMLPWVIDLKRTTHTRKDLGLS